MLLGKVSTSERIVAPVVVKPLTLSKNASVKDGMEPLIINGIAPKRLVVIHAEATTTKAVFVRSSIFLFLKKRLIKSKKIQLQIIGIAKEGIMDVSLYANAVVIGIKQVVPIMPRRSELILKSEISISVRKFLELN